MSYRTAWLVKHKLMAVMFEQERDRRLQGVAQIDAAFLGGERTGGKRGRGSENKLPLVAAVQTTASGQAIFTRLDVLREWKVPTVARWAVKALAPSTHVVSDALYSVNSGKPASCSHEPIIHGTGKQSVQHPRSMAIDTLLGNLKMWMNTTLGGFKSSHYAMRYMAEFRLSLVPNEEENRKKKPAQRLSSRRRFGAGRPGLPGQPQGDQLRWLLISFVISNIETCAFLKMSFSLASALIIVRLALSCRPFFLMYSHTFLVTSVRGIGVEPITAASVGEGVIAFMNAALGVRFLAGAAFFAGAAAFLAGAAFLAAGAAFFAATAFFAGAAFFAAGAAFLAGAAFFVAVAMSILSIKRSLMCGVRVSVA